MDKEKVIAWLADTELYYRENGKTSDELYQSEMAHDAIELLQEQEAEIRQLRLALGIAKGMCNGIKVEGRRSVNE